MDECKLTPEQIRLLANGERVQISYSSLEAYGGIDQHCVELIPLGEDESNEDNRT